MCISMFIRKTHLFCVEEFQFHYGYPYLDLKKRILLRLSLQNDQVVLVRETRVLKMNGRSISVTLSKSDNVLSSQEPVAKGVVRIPQFQQTIAITSHGVNAAKGLFADLHYCFSGHTNTVYRAKHSVARYCHDKLSVRL